MPVRTALVFPRLQLHTLYCSRSAQHTEDSIQLMVKILEDKFTSVDHFYLYTVNCLSCPAALFEEQGLFSFFPPSFASNAIYLWGILLIMLR